MALSEEDFAARVDHEGGVFGALEHGFLKPDDLPPGELKELWSEVYDHFWDDNFQGLLDEVREELDKHYDFWD